MRRHRISDLIRGTARICALAAVVAWSAASLIRPSTRRDLAARARWLQRCCRRALRVLGVRVTTTGAPPVGGVVLTPNHLGYIDILVLAASTPTVFVAKLEVRGWPIFGWMAARAGTRFIDRGRTRDVARVGAELDEAIQAGLAVVVFLEGTSSDGREVLAFKPSLLEPAVAAGWDVAPVALRYAVPPGRSAANEVCWWGDMQLALHLANFATLERIDADLAWGARLGAAGDRKHLAQTLRSQVIDLLRDRRVT